MALTFEQLSILPSGRVIFNDNKKLRIRVVGLRGRHKQTQTCCYCSCVTSNKTIIQSYNKDKIIDRWCLQCFINSKENKGII